MKTPKKVSYSIKVEVEKEVWNQFRSKTLLTGKTVKSTIEKFIQESIKEISKK